MDLDRVSVRRKRGDGSVLLRGDGLWQGRVYFWSGGRRRRKSLYDRSREALELRMQAFREDNPPIPRVRRVKRADATGFVYFVQMGDDGPIKIGYTKNLASRLQGIAHGVPHSLRVLGFRAGTRADETAIMTLLRATHIKGEWFGPSEEIAAFVRTFCQEP